MVIYPFGYSRRSLVSAAALFYQSSQYYHHPFLASARSLCVFLELSARFCLIFIHCTLSASTGVLSSKRCRSRQKLLSKSPKGNSRFWLLAPIDPACHAYAAFWRQSPQCITVLADEQAKRCRNVASRIRSYICPLHTGTAMIRCHVSLSVCPADGGGDDGRSNNRDVALRS